MTSGKRKNSHFIECILAYYDMAFRKILDMYIVSKVYDENDMTLNMIKPQKTSETYNQ